MMKPTYPGSNDPKHPKLKFTIKEFLKLITGIACFVAVIWFIVFAVKSSNTYKTIKGNSSIVKDLPDIKVATYARGNITYLIFYANGTSLQVQNYTADSLRMVEYYDYEQSIRDTFPENSLFSGKTVQLFPDSFSWTLPLNPPLLIDSTGKSLYIYNVSE